MLKSGRSSGHSKRKHSKAEPYKSIAEQPEVAAFEEAPAEQATWPPPSFLFTVYELPVNDEPTQGGEAPRVDDQGRWYPPVRRNGFMPQYPSCIYRWAEGGRISSASECQWLNGRWCSRTGSALTEYRASTMFWCDNFNQFMVAKGDASLRNMDPEDPENKWWPLTFRHEGLVSQVEESGEETRLAGIGNWIDALGMASYRNRRAHTGGGLAGNLAIVVGLVAFSCESVDLDKVLLTDRAWRRGRWHGHGRVDGRIEHRGVVVTIYLDPENTQGSTHETIYPLEWSSGPLLF